MIKSERFELRLDQDMIERLDRWRSLETDHPSRSEAARRLMERGLSERVSISGGERLILSLLSGLLKDQKLPSGANSDFIIEALVGGHYWALEWEFPGLFHGHVDSNKCLSDVLNYLDMWSTIEESFEILSDDRKKELAKELKSSQSFKFTGFDGNNETEHLGIARFLIEKMNRFQRFKGRDLNSHMMTLGGYKRMFSEFEKIRTNIVGRSLSPQELANVINELIHPENR